MADAERYSFRNLDLWKATQQFAVDVFVLVDGLPNGRTADVVGRQLLRSATSIGANIAEGHARFAFGAYRNHLSIAKGSAGESEHWIDLLVRRGLITSQAGDDLSRAYVRLMGALTRRIRYLEEKEKGQPRIREEGGTFDVPVPLVPWFSGSMVPDDLSVEDDR